jgi:[CysO sulfur-carrier protein]-S-L-cysteine hydrolase
MAMMLSRFRLQIPMTIFQDMIAHARAELPNECVGLLAGTQDGKVMIRLPLVNLLADPTRFESEPRSMFQAEKARREAGLEFLAVYHSHPSNPSVPSRHDLAWHYSPEVQCVIISLAKEPPEVAGFWLETDRYEEAGWLLIPRGLKHEGDYASGRGRHQH